METSGRERRGDIHRFHGEEAGGVFPPRHGEATDSCPALRGLRQRRNGSWKAHIWHPISRQRLKLGTFSSAEEVSRACLPDSLSSWPLQRRYMIIL